MVRIVKIRHYILHAASRNLLFGRDIIVNDIYLADQQKRMRIDIAFGANLFYRFFSESEVYAESAYNP